MNIKQPDWKDLRHTASQCRNIRTNPASYKPEELENKLDEMADNCKAINEAMLEQQSELIEQWEREKEQMAARCLKLREGLEAVIVHFEDSAMTPHSCAQEMAYIAERALRVK